MKVTITGILLLCLSLSSVTAWWEIGHMTVSQVAQLRLQDLGETAALDKFTELIVAFSNLTDGRTNTFVEAAVWPDDIKQYEAKYFNDYHFTDIVYDPQNLFAAMTQFQKDVNSINVVKSAQDVLKTNRDGITFERGFMARFLLHLAGDIHQPLHSASMYNSTYPTGDYGGNAESVTTVDGQVMKLHAFMDSMAGEQKNGERMQRPLTEDGWNYIRGLAQSIMKEFPADSFGQDSVNNLDSHSWTVESYNTAVDKVYPYVFKTDQLSQQFTDEMFTLCRQRVAIAGYRLASVIVDIYK